MRQRRWAATGWRRCRPGRHLTHPQVVDTMGRYLQQIACVLRPGSVNGADLALRSFAGVPGRGRTRGHQHRRRSPAATSRTTSRGWQHGPDRTRPGLTTATIAHRLGTLRMFFVRIDEWGWDEAPGPGADVPRRPAPPGPPAAQGARRRRRREAAARRPERQTAAGARHRGSVAAHRAYGSASSPTCRADAVVLIGAGPWLHVPVGKLREDRYLPLHPHLVTLIDDYRNAHVPAGASAAAAQGERPATGPAHRHPVHQQGRRRRRPAAFHPHQLRHTLATQAINRGMSLEAIAAMLGHRSLDMTLRYAKIANRTVADEYFAVTDKVEALYGQAPVLPADAIGPKMARLRREHHRMLGNGYCTRPASWTAPSSRSVRPARSSRPASSSGPPCKPNTTTPPTKARPTGRTCSAHCFTESTRTRHDHHHQPPSAADPTRPDARSRRRRPQRNRSGRGHRHPRRAPHPLLARRLRRAPARPGQPPRPSPTRCCPTPSPKPATKDLTWDQIGQLLGLTGPAAARRYRPATRKEA